MDTFQSYEIDIDKTKEIQITLRQNQTDSLNKADDINRIENKINTVIGQGVIPEMFPRNATEKDDTPRINRAIQYALKNNMNNIELKAEVLELGSTLHIPSGFKFFGKGATRDNPDMSTRITRNADVVAISAKGTPNTNGTVGKHLQGIHFEGIEFHGGRDNYFSDFMQLEVASMFNFINCLFKRMSGRQLYMREVMDSRFINCAFEDCLSTTVPSVELESGTTSNGKTYEYTNQIIFTNCRWEAYRGTALKVTGNYTNELFFTDTKFESLQSNQRHWDISNATVISLSNVQVCSRGMKDVAKNITVDAILKFNNCSGIKGNLYMEHMSAGTSLDSFITLDNPVVVDLFVFIYSGQELLTGNNAVKLVNNYSADTVNLNGGFKSSSTTKRIPRYYYANRIQTSDCVIYKKTGKPYSFRNQLRELEGGEYKFELIHGNGKDEKVIMDVAANGEITNRQPVFNNKAFYLPILDSTPWFNRDASPIWVDKNTGELKTAVNGKIKTINLS